MSEEEIKPETDSVTVAKSLGIFCSTRILKFLYYRKQILYLVAMVTSVVRRECIRPTNKEIVIFKTIRQAICYRYPELTELVEEQFGCESGDDEGFAYALYLYLRALPNLNVAVDEWRTLQIIREKQDFLRVVGLMYVLPGDELPMEVVLRRVDSSTHYWLRFGISDSIWSSFSESKRWKLVYCFANGHSDEQWAWSDPIEGYVRDPL